MNATRGSMAPVMKEVYGRKVAPQANRRAAMMGGKPTTLRAAYMRQRAAGAARRPR